MKLNKIFGLIAAALLIVPSVASAQGLKIITKDGKTTLVPYKDLDKVTVYDDKPEAIDLGLSVKWASFNVGATAPEDYGSYFMWAGTVDDPELKYNKLTCPYQDPDFADPDDFIDYFLKYCNNQDLGIPDRLTTLEPMDDAATVAYGDDWRMPTEKEMKELIEKCEIEKLESGNEEFGISGFKLTGPNGNSIFLPNTGYRFLTSFWYQDKELNYWTSSLDTSSCMYAMALSMPMGYGTDVPLVVTYKGRYQGFTVRAVTEK